MTKQQPETQGQKANRRGDALHLDILDTLRRFGNLMPAKPAAAGHHLIAELKHIMRFHDERCQTHAGLFAPCARTGRNVFKRLFEVDAVVWRRSWESPLCVFGVFQESGGSVNQKLPFMLESLRLQPMPSVLLLAGSELLGDAGIMCYVREEIGRSGGKILRLFRGMDEFRTWVSDGMAWPGDPQTAFA